MRVFGTEFGVGIDVGVEQGNKGWRIKIGGEKLGEWGVKSRSGNR